LIQRSPKIAGTSSSLRPSSPLISSANHTARQLSQPGNTSMAPTTLTPHPWVHQGAVSSPTPRPPHDVHGTSAATRVSMSDQHSTTTDATR
jgi:hypothetical protein